MFYYEKWVLFCKKVSSLEIKTCSASELLNSESIAQFIVLKHDVETNLSKALKLAEIEASFGIRGSYYIQAYLLDKKSNINDLRKIRELGHEVSYHYDVLDANNGNMEAAKIEFKKKMDTFAKKGFIIKTICQHGNPLKERVGYNSNRDFFRNKEVREEYNGIADIVVNYKELLGRDYLYISDAGYSWNIIDDPENNDRYETKPNIKINGYDDVINIIKKGNSIIMSTHPHRWESGILKLKIKIFLFRFVRAISRKIYKLSFFKSIINRFYFLAKKI